MAAIGRQLKQSVKVFHNLMLYLRLPGTNIRQSINQSINQSNQSINQSNQLTNPIINYEVKRSMNHSINPLHTDPNLLNRVCKYHQTMYDCTKSKQF